MFHVERPPGAGGPTTPRFTWNTAGTDAQVGQGIPFGWL